MLLVPSKIDVTMPLVDFMPPTVGGPTLVVDGPTEPFGYNGPSPQHDSDSESVIAEAEFDAPLPPHPLGVKPLGNKYLDQGTDAKEATGLFQTLPDELLMLMVETLDMDSLRALGSTCRFLYAACIYDELWKALALG